VTFELLSERKLKVGELNLILEFSLVTTDSPFWCFTEHKSIQITLIETRFILFARILSLPLYCLCYCASQHISVFSCLIWKSKSYTSIHLSSFLCPKNSSSILFWTYKLVVIMSYINLDTKPLAVHTMLSNTMFCLFAF